MSVWNVLQQAKGVGAAFSRLATASIVSKYPEGCTTPTIGTHDGTFHCDEALACAILLQLPAYQGATIVRSRKQDQLDQCDIVVDVGAVYDHEKKRYDHHQKTFTETLAELGHRCVYPPAQSVSPFARPSLRFRDTLTSTVPPPPAASS